MCLPYVDERAVVDSERRAALMHFNTDQVHVHVHVHDFATFDYVHVFQLF